MKSVTRTVTVKVPWNVPVGNAPVTMMPIGTTTPGNLPQTEQEEAMIMLASKIL